MFNAGLFRAPAFPHDSLSSPPSANPTREAGFYAPTVQCLRCVRLLWILGLVTYNFLRTLTAE